MKKILNKKGSIQDIAFLAVLIFFIGIVILISFKVSTEYNTNIQANTNIPNEAKIASSQIKEFFPGVVDNTILFLVIGIGIVSLAMASLVKVHPVFIVFFLIGLVFITFLSATFSDVYEEISLNPSLSSEVSELTNISFIVKTAPIFIFVLGLILMFIMYNVGKD